VGGTITQLETAQPVTDARVHLIDPWTLASASPLAGTDADGGYLFEELAPGDYTVCVYHDTLLLFDRTAELAHVKAGERTTHDVRLLDSELWSDQGYRVAGTVIDAQSGDSLGGAYVEGIFWAMQDVGPRLAGHSNPWWAVTDTSGGFSVRVSVWTDEQGYPEGLEPISVSRLGYEPATLGGGGRFYEFPSALPLPPEGDSTLILQVALQRLNDEGIGPRGAGAIAGRVTCLGEPVAEIRVAVSLLSSAYPDTVVPPLAVLAVPIPDRVTVTDDEGRFLIDRLSPGDYVVHPGYLDGDGYVYETYGGYGAWLFEVADAETTEARSIEVQRAIAPLTPPDRSIIDDPTPEFVWEAFPDTTACSFGGYKLQYATSHIDWRVVDDLQVPRWELPEEAAFRPGTSVRWLVEVLGTPDSTSYERRIAQFEHAATFTVAE
jgi:hypothetical protein